MSQAALTNEAFDTVFQSPLLNNDTDPSSDQGMILDWLSNVLESDPNQIQEPPLRIRNSLRNIDPSNSFFFDYFVESVRSQLTYQGNVILKLFQNYDQIFALFDWLEGINSKLNHCCSLIEFSPKRILLIQRTVSSIFRSVALEPLIWNNVRLLFQNGLFSTTDATQLDLTTFEHVSQLLLVSELGEDLRNLLLSLTREHLKEYINTHCKSVWNKPALPILLHWIKQDLYPKIKRVFPKVDFGSELLESMVKTELLEIRIQDCFDIVIDYPDSECALKEINECLLYNHQKNHLLNVFTQLCNKRLLHAGANTIDIIASYRSTVRSFLIIDHRGVLLDKACRPIQRYLKERKDTVERIVFAMLDLSPSNKLIEIAYELRQNFNDKPKAQDTVRTLNWAPDPHDALPDFRKGIAEDVVESLISIFDSQNLFMEEFSRVFSKDLLTATDYDIQQCIDKLELVKPRFPNCDFTTLNVMFKDLKNSSNVDKNIHEDKEAGSLADSNIHASIISRLYWPELDNVSFKIPQEIDSQLHKYKEIYESHQKGRKLTLLPSLGIVSLEVELRGESMTFDVTPDKAAVLYLFQEMPEGAEINIAILCMKLQMPIQLVRESISFWIKNGVIQETKPNTYKTLE